MTITVTQTTEFASATTAEHNACLASAQSASPPAGVTVSVDEDVPNKTVTMTLVATQELP